MSQFGLTATNSWGYGSAAGYAGYLPGPLSSCAAQAPFPPPPPPPSLTSFAGTASMTTPTAPDSTAGSTVVTGATSTTPQQDAFSTVSSRKFQFLSSFIFVEYFSEWKNYVRPLQWYRIRRRRRSLTLWIRWTRWCPVRRRGTRTTFLQGHCRRIQAPPRVPFTKKASVRIMEIIFPHQPVFCPVYFTPSFTRISSKILRIPSNVWFRKAVASDRRKFGLIITFGGRTNGSEIISKCLKINPRIIIRFYWTDLIWRYK